MRKHHQQIVLAKIQSFTFFSLDSALLPRDHQQFEVIQPFSFDLIPSDDTLLKGYLFQEKEVMLEIHLCILNSDSIIHK